MDSACSSSSQAFCWGTARPRSGHIKSNRTSSCGFVYSELGLPYTRHTPSASATRNSSATWYTTRPTACGVIAPTNGRNQREQQQRATDKNPRIVAPGDSSSTGAKSQCSSMPSRSLTSLRACWARFTASGSMSMPYSSASSRS